MSNSKIIIASQAITIYKYKSIKKGNYLIVGDRSSSMVKVLCYKSEGRWFDPSWCLWIFHWHKILPIAQWSWGSAQPLTEMSTTSISWGQRRPVRKADNLSPSCAVVTQSGNLNPGTLWATRACNGTALPFLLNCQETSSMNLFFGLFIYIIIT